MYSQPKGKSIILAYIFWLFGGIFGLHLFYLERDAHAFLTWSTLGGYGLGWLADVTKIPRYVRDCNEDPKFLEELADRMRKNKKVCQEIMKCYYLICRLKHTFLSRKSVIK